MKLKTVFLTVLIMIFAAVLYGCSKKTSTSPGKTVLFVSILPQKYLVSRIAGNNAEIEVMVRPGHSPANYEPLPKQMAAVSEASLYFSIGVPFERVWLDRIRANNPELEIIDTNLGIKFRHFDTFEEDEESDGDHEEHDHDHEGEDPHTWLSPSLAVVQSRNICEALSARFPENRAIYEKNLSLLVSDLKNLSDDIRNALKDLPSREIMVFHPAFGYFADEFGLKQIPIEIEGKEPGPESLKKMIDLALERNIKVIFVQKQFSTKSAESVAEATGGSVVQIDPLGEDYISNLHSIAETIAESSKK